jgi:hypothetical protein
MMARLDRRSGRVAEASGGLCMRRPSPGAVTVRLHLATTDVIPFSCRSQPVTAGGHVARDGAGIGRSHNLGATARR